MSNLHTSSGVNNCYWNINFRCTNPKITGNKPVTYFNYTERDWDSKINCTLTQFGAQKICSEYKLED